MSLARKAVAAVGATVAAAFAVFAVAGPAAATDSVTLTATIKSTPDDGCPAWARDTFTRTTTITEVEADKYKVVIADKGEFTTVVGSTSPAGAGPIANAVTGTIVGEGEFTVVGKLKGADALANLDGKIFNNGGFPCKADVPAARTTGQWPAQFFKTEPAPQISGIDPWTWTYETPCEKRVESSTAEPVGDITGLQCPAESPSPSPSPTVSSTASPEPSVSASSPAPGAGGGEEDPSLPVTGVSVPLLVSGAVALLAMGGVLFAVTRRRRIRTVA